MNKLLNWLRGLFKVHSPSEEWPLVNRKNKYVDLREFEETPKPERRHRTHSILAMVSFILLLIAVILLSTSIFLVPLTKEPRTDEKPATEQNLPSEEDIMEPIEEEPVMEVAEPVVEEVKVEPKVLYFDVPLSEDLQDTIFTECESRDVDPAIIVAMIKRESDYNPNCISDGGKSFGLMQIQPRWHQSRANKLGCPDLMNPYDNVTVGIDLFASLYKQGGSLEWALMAYNGGPSYANRKTKNGEVSDYARAVIRNSKLLERV